jgi:hypothetical protein
MVGSAHPEYQDSGMAIMWFASRSALIAAECGDPVDWARIRTPLASVAFIGANFWRCVGTSYLLSSMTSSIFRPPMPPSALILSQYTCWASTMSLTRVEKGPDRSAIMPTRIVSASAP